MKRVYLKGYSTMLKDLEPIADKLMEERGILNRVLDRLTDEKSEEVKVTPEWSVKDEIAHLAGAERGMLGIARNISQGVNPRLPEGYNNDTFNARQVAKRKAQTLAQIRAELEGYRNDLMALLDSITPEQLKLCGEHPLAGNVSLKDLLVIIYSHETTHTNEISEKIRGSNK